MGGSGSHQSVQVQPKDNDPEAWRKFFVILTGKTNGAHEPVVRRLESKGQKEVKSPEDAHYYLVFCPVVSRVGTDVSEAMDHVPGDKQAVLVVMHHTLNRKQVIPRSSRVVQDRRVQLTLDCLFHQNQLLKSALNTNMNTNIEEFFPGQGVSCFGPCLAPSSGPHEEMDGLKKQNVEEMEAHRKQTAEAMEALKKQNADLRDRHAEEIEALKKQNKKPLKEETEQTQQDALPVKSRSRDVSVPTNSEGELRSMDLKATFSRKMPAMAEGRPLRDRSEDKAPDTWRKFFVILTGRTNGAHEPVVRRLKSKGQKEVKSRAKADYYLVFCPVVSRVGTDVSEAMDHVPGDKQVVLVVMHHTLNRRLVIPRSSRVVQDRRVRLTLDCMFHQNKLLDSKLNKKMNTNIEEFFPGQRSCCHICRAPASDDDRVY